MQMPSLDKKQTFVATALVIVVFILIWQVYSLFFETPAAPIPSKPVVNTAPVIKATPATPTAETTSVNTLAITDPNQQRYLTLLEEYKIAELQKMIAQDKQAIATSQAATAEALAKMNQLGVNASTVDFGFNKAPSTADAQNNSSFVLVYTGLQDGQWTATLKRGNDTFDVMVGTVIDNSKVTRIDNNEVVLQNPEHIIHINFDGTTSVLASKAAAMAKVQASVAPTTASATASVAQTEPATSQKAKDVDGIIQTPALPVAPVNTSKTAAQPKPVVTATAETPSKQQISTNSTSDVKTSLKTQPVNNNLQAEPKTHTKPFVKPEHEASGVTKLWHTVTQWVDQKIHPKSETSPYFFDHTQTKAATNVTATPPTAAPHDLNTVSLSHVKTSKATDIKNLNDSLANAVIAPEAATAKTEAPATKATSDSYTIQLATLSQEDLDTFLQTKDLKETYAKDYKVFKRTTGNQVRYIVALGSYPTREAAKEAYDSLPATLSKGAPYIRSLADVQNEADQAQ